jgi:hypothetical protein
MNFKQIESEIEQKCLDNGAENPRKFFTFSPEETNYEFSFVSIKVSSPRSF